jgi:integrase
MRQAELLGLRWEDVDLNTGSVRITQTIQWISGKGFVVQSPKTKHGRRAIVLSPAAIALLRGVKIRQSELRLQLGPAYRLHDLVFSVTDGGPINARNLMRAFYRMLDVAGLPPIRFHDLRHTHATMLLEQDVHPKIVSERLGHASVGITLDTYSHVLPSMQRALADRLDTWIGADSMAEEHGA